MSKILKYISVIVKIFYNLIFTFMPNLEAKHSDFIICLFTSFLFLGCTHVRKDSILLFINFILLFVIAIYISSIIQGRYLYPTIFFVIFLIIWLLLLNRCYILTWYYDFDDLLQILINIRKSEYPWIIDLIDTDYKRIYEYGKWRDISIPGYFKVTTDFVKNPSYPFYYQNPELTLLLMKWHTEPFIWWYA